MNKKEKIIFIYGNFNIVHPGHLRLFRYAKSFKAKLVVGVASDKIGGASIHVPQKYRIESVKSNQWVDKAFIYNKSILDVIKELKPNILLKGKEYEAKVNPEEEVLKLYGGKLVFGSGDISFSSLDLLQKEITESTNSLSIPHEYIGRHSIEKDAIKKLISKFKKINSLVIGDLIIDRYTTCEPLGMSQEDPTLVIQPISSEEFLGGAGIVASHASGLGANSYFISVVGNDPSAMFAKNKLKENNVKFSLFTDDSRPTSLKQRYRAKGKTLLRVSELAQDNINKLIQDKIFRKIQSIINDLDLIIFSDFNYGVLPQDLVTKIINLAKKHDVMLVADSQSSSQTGDISRFFDMDLITPTEREARLSVRDNQIGIANLIEKVRDLSNSKNVFMKLGEEGLLIHSGKKINSDEGWVDKLSALNLTPKDVAGAGDSLLISSALSLSAGSSIWEAALIGSLAASIQVGRLGNIPIKHTELENEINFLDS